MSCRRRLGPRSVGELSGDSRLPWGRTTEVKSRFSGCCPCSENPVVAGQTSSGPLIVRPSVTAPGSGNDASGSGQGSPHRLPHDSTVAPNETPALVLGLAQRGRPGRVPGDRLHRGRLARSLSGPFFEDEVGAPPE